MDATRKLGLFGIAGVLAFAPFAFAASDKPGPSDRMPLFVAREQPLICKPGRSVCTSAAYDLRQRLPVTVGTTIRFLVPDGVAIAPETARAVETVREGAGSGVSVSDSGEDWVECRWSAASRFSRKGRASGYCVVDRRLD